MTAPRALPRVVITGMGCLSALGLTASATWAAMRAGAAGIRPIEGMAEHQLRTAIAAQLAGYVPGAYFDDKRLVQLDPVSQYALVAAREAVAQAGISFKAAADGDRADRTAVIIGTGIGGAHTQDHMAQRLYGERNLRVHPMAIVRVMPNAPAAQISLELGLRGPVFAVASACASANHAIAQALMQLQSGVADVALAGGVEACITPGTVRAWEAMRVMADDTCRPFSQGRRGLVLGEGAGVFVLETLAHAQARGAVVLCELAGAGMTADAADIVMPDASGAARAMRAALAHAGLAPEEVHYINAHGTGTVANDATETRAIRAVFGRHADALAVSSTKSMHGHALGGGGAIELVAVVGALRDGVVPPTINYTGSDPECDLNVVPNVAQQRPVHAALSNSFAFGGLNAVLALKRWA
jgi:nodulation protein E